MQIKTICLITKPEKLAKIEGQWPMSELSLARLQSIEVARF